MVLTWSLTRHERSSNAPTESDRQIHLVDELLYLSSTLCEQGGRRSMQRPFRKEKGPLAERVIQLTGQDFSHLEADEFAEVVDSLIERDAYLSQDFPPLGSRHSPPRLVRPPRRHQRRIDLVRARGLHAREGFPRRGTDRVLHLAGTVPPLGVVVIDAGDWLTRCGESERREDARRARRERSTQAASVPSPSQSQSKHTVIPCPSE